MISVRQQCWYDFPLNSRRAPIQWGHEEKHEARPRILADSHRSTRRSRRTVGGQRPATTGCPDQCPCFHRKWVRFPMDAGVLISHCDSPFVSARGGNQRRARASGTALVLTVVDEMCFFFNFGTAINAWFDGLRGISLRAGVPCS